MLTLSTFLPLIIAEAAGGSQLPASSGDSRIDWLNMLGWFLTIIINGGIAFGLARRKPPIGEDVTLIKAAVDSEKSRVNEVKARLISAEGKLAKVDELRSDLNARSITETHMAKRLDGIEKRIEQDLHEIKERLGHGDGIFEQRSKELSDLRAAVAAINSTVEAMRVAVNLIQQSHQQLIADAKSWRT